MTLTEVLGFVSQVGGLAALGVVGKAAIGYFVQPKGERLKAKIDERAAEVDALDRLLSLTPNDVVRLHERLITEEARSKNLSDQLSISETKSRALRDDLVHAHSEIRSLRGQMEQMSIQLSNALTEIQAMREKERGTK
jgi:septal ring factor EnvC (AmiA/AmiB activator)